MTRSPLDYEGRRADVSAYAKSILPGAGSWHYLELREAELLMAMQGPVYLRKTADGRDVFYTDDEGAAIFDVIAVSEGREGWKKY